MKAKPTAPVIPMSVRIRLISMSAQISSQGRKGLTKRCPRLRDHISSMNTRERPIWPRNMMSHRMTPASRTPAAWANHELLVMRNMVTRPQMIT